VPAEDEQKSSTVLKIPDLNAKDFTCYCENDLPVSKWREYQGKPFKRGNQVFGSFSEQVSLGPSQAEARVIFCSCFKGVYVSRTVRRTGKTMGKIPIPKPARGPLRSNFSPSTERGHLNTIKQISEALYEKLFEAETEGLQSQPGGLILVTGSTNVAKSEIAKALTHIHLQQELQTGRTRPQKARVLHLVTIEDPIETYFRRRPSRSSQVDYTPRQIGVDVQDVKTGIEDALRQTPSVLFVGEVRDSTNFPLLLEFGGSGHLAITTAHAGTLQEGMNKLLRSSDAKTPAQRSIVARCLRGIVHLKTCEVEGVTGVIPALWRKTPSGEMALISDGVSSVLPHRDHHAFSLGRTWFVERLVHHSRRNDVCKRALDWDYRGA
jgi:hypothetical protein